ncbi:Nicotine blue oxidoreductase [Pseudovibrio axinellae]|uniref:Nicotine blue oxidoreductase n=1 Tax=Pseudovibrio axinellae TaxID=989403 RepID=A0A165T447_9HYPH|nr:nucleotidyltransferase family protein [Pseudovibrio axinellae]KZL05405.1 Nicotine blue oxidoreductase [Pseudovibrio axinellae]SEQ00665.1 molybdenum cofactor cytidylyltransferase [Pseudovibrio axinellae]
MNTLADFEVVLAAAGLSRRMGAVNKLLLRIDDEPLIRKAARLYSSLGMRVIVVTGHEADKTESALDGVPVTTVFNPHYMEGQRTSIQVGLQHASLDRKGLVIALADQPELTSQDISALCNAHQTSRADKILVPYFKGQRGNPIVFPCSIARRLMHSGQIPGCRRFIDENPALVRRFKAPNHHFTSDIDCPADLGRLQSTNLIIKE